MPVNKNLEIILAAREHRMQRQKALLKDYEKPLLSFTMNIAGPTKNSPLISLAFRAGIRRIQAAIGIPLHCQIIEEESGCEALMVYDIPASELKKQCIFLEEGTPIGRLYDLDVLDGRGEKISRPVSRKCLVCSGPVSLCARNRAHGLEAVQNATQILLRQFAAEYLSMMAAEALRREVHLTPKPGLVDEINSGAHHDMDLPLFEKSIVALRPWFAAFINLGLEGASAQSLHQAGITAEKAMFTATDGINTHKGALYIFALILSAIGRILAIGGTWDDVFSQAAKIANQLPVPQGTHGSSVRTCCGGVRQEAMAGFPHARQMAKMLEEESPQVVLLWSMAHTDDSTLVYRGGLAGLQFVQQQAAEILSAPEDKKGTLMQELDAELIARHLSPGGSADLLSLSLFLQDARFLFS